MAGFTKAWKKELRSDIWKMPPIYHRVWFWIRQKVEYETSEFPTRQRYNIWVLPGQMLTSYQHIAEGVAWSEYGVEKVPNKKMIREVLEWLKKEEMIEIFSNAKGTLISVVNWDTYNNQEAEKVTQKGQQKKRKRGTPKEVVEGKEGIEVIDKDKKNIYGEYKKVLLTTKQYDKLVKDFGETKTMGMIKILDEWAQETGKVFKANADHNLSIRKEWVSNKYEGKDNGKPKSSGRKMDYDAHVRGG